MSFFSVYAPQIPSIGVGNLAFGGSGKSPMTIYLAELLISKSLRVAIVSRGYGRSTSGVLRCNAEHTAKEIGDEPKMYVTKLPEVEVVVAEKRKAAIQYLEQQSKPPQVIILDDCYQHRAIKPKILLLLSEFNTPYWKDFLVPSGYLRDVKTAASRADALIITKSVEEKTLKTPAIWTKKPVFYSKIYYQQPTALGIEPELRPSVISFSAIASDTLFKGHLAETVELVKSFSFADHHYFSTSELEEIIIAADNNHSIITTEKDAARLNSGQLKLLSTHSFFVLPITTPVKDAKKFEEFILNGLDIK